MSIRRAAGARVCVLTLGCPKNSVDSERLMAALERRGYLLAADPEEAEIVVVNTCAFIEDAQRESIDEVLRIGAMKGKSGVRHLVVAGCLAERHGSEILREMPEVDGLVGPGRLAELPDVLDRLAEGESLPPVCLGGFDPASESGPHERVRTGAPHLAYVKIAEGCDHRCAYCLIPRLRGPQRSRPPERVVAEVEALAAEGAREVILVAQDTTAYGRDLPERPTLAALLDRLEGCDGPDWIRVLYTHPAHWDDALIERFAAGGRLLPYIDLPIQHASDPVLRAMRRGYGADRLRRLITRMRERIPQLVLRTTVITGHPGEDARACEALQKFLTDFPFDRLGAFAYSPEVDPRTAVPESAVARREAERRRDQILELQRKIAVTMHGRRKGMELDLLLDGVHGERGFAIGRSYGEAPDIDGVVYVKRSASRAALEPGRFVRARIIGAGPYDLVAVPAEVDGDRRGAAAAGGLQ